MEIESCYKNILISMHGGILCHFKREENELIPYITTNELNNLREESYVCISKSNINIINKVTYVC